MVLRLVSKIGHSAIKTGSHCLQYQSQGTHMARIQDKCYLMSCIHSSVAKTVLKKRNVTKTKKFVYGLGMISVATIGAYQIFLEEPQRRKVRVTVGGFGRFYR